jgi:hypothetical protein
MRYLIALHRRMPRRRASDLDRRADGRLQSVALRHQERDQKQLLREEKVNDGKLAQSD